MAETLITPTEKGTMIISTLRQHVLDPAKALGVLLKIQQKFYLLVKIISQKMELVCTI